MNNQKEYILCFVIHYDDGVINLKRRCKNYPEIGIVICEYRHADIISILPTNNTMRNDGKIYNCIQGFLTSLGRFVTREEAYIIAKKSKSIIRK